MPPNGARAKPADRNKHNGQQGEQESQIASVSSDDSMGRHEPFGRPLLARSGDFRRDGPQGANLAHSGVHAKSAAERRKRKLRTTHYRDPTRRVMAGTEVTGPAAGSAVPCDAVVTADGA